MTSSRLRLIWIIILITAVTPLWAAETPSQEQPKPLVIPHLHLSGQLTEAPVADPFNLSGSQMTGLRKLIDRLQQIEEDSEVPAVVLTYNRMSMGFGQMQEVRQALGRVQAAGKTVYVHAEGMQTFVYGLLSVADSLSVAPESSLWLTGFYGESLYLKNLLDKIGVEAEILHMGDFKSAGEIYTRTGPSDEAAANLNWIFDGYYEALVNMIATSREKTPDQIRSLIDQGPYLANAAKEKGLIDHVETRAAFLERVEKEIGQPINFNNRYGAKQGKTLNLANPFAFFTVLAEMLQPPQPSEDKDVVAIVYVEGAILPGHGQASPFGSGGAAYSGDIRKALETVARDDDVKAVVLRVNSPGGSAEASEVILNATRQVQAEKPLIVSMGNMAASGGYYVSCAADEIYADECTLTASIGVVGGKLITKGMWDKIGISWASYQRGANADIFSSNQGFSDHQRQVFLDYMNQVYDVFKGHVTKGRGYRLRKPIDEIAGGRVYTGKQALDLGLVDYLGGLKDAIEAAAKKASLDDYDVRVVPQPKDFITQLLEESSGQNTRPSDIALSLSGFQPLLQTLQRTEPQRARTLIQALHRIDLIGQESVILMMPEDIVMP